MKDIDLKKPIVLTGHSLGASIATFAAVSIAHKNPDADVRLITFGCPKIGNLAFAQLFQKTIKPEKNFRFVTEKDVVPIVAAIYDYVQVSDAYCIKENCVMKQEEDVHWILAFFNSLSKSPIYMHSCNTYTKLLFSLQRKS
jgi:predicted lipase